MEIVKMQLSELNPAAYNPRKSLRPGDPVYEKLKASMLSFGNVEPIVWNRTTGNVVGGHQRLRVLLDLGITETEVSVVDLTETDEKRLNIALNKITGEWDDEKLAALLSDIISSGADVYPTGFDDQELATLFADVSKATAHDDKFDLTAALEKATFVERGDVWTVGRHRLVCGDATSEEDVALLMDGKKANLIVTDPPYGVSFKSSDGLTIKNDSIKGEAFYQFLYQSFSNMVAHLEKGGAAYVFHADTEGLSFRRAFMDAGFHLAGVCIWVKNSLVLGRSDYQWQHEPVLYGFLQNGKHHWYSESRPPSGTMISPSGMRTIPPPNRWNFWATRFVIPPRRTGLSWTPLAVPAPPSWPANSWGGSATRWNWMKSTPPSSSAAMRRTQRIPVASMSSVTAKASPMRPW